MAEGLKVTDKHGIKVHEPGEFVEAGSKPQEEEAALLVLLVHVPHGGLRVGQGGLVHHLYHMAHLGRSVETKGSDGTYHRKADSWTWQFGPFPVGNVVMGEPEQQEGDQQGNHHPLAAEGECRVLWSLLSN